MTDPLKTYQEQAREALRSRGIMNEADRDLVQPKLDVAAIDLVIAELAAIYKVSEQPNGMSPGRLLDARIAHYQQLKGEISRSSQT